MHIIYTGTRAPLSLDERLSRISDIAHGFGHGVLHPNEGFQPLQPDANAIIDDEPRTARTRSATDSGAVFPAHYITAAYLGSNATLFATAAATHLLAAAAGADAMIHGALSATLANAYLYFRRRG